MSLQLALGLALLSKSLLLPIAPLFLVIAVWRRPVREAVVTVMLVAALAVVTVAPTLAANARRTGSPSIANSSRCGKSLESFFPSTA